MKTQIPTKIETNITHIGLECAVNYEEEEIPNDFPGRKGELWTARINIDTGKIEGWPTGRVATMHLTCKDCGVYTLYAEDGREVAKRDGYVPHCIIPGDYGDVIKIAIAADGTITNWPKNPDLTPFFEEED